MKRKMKAAEFKDASALTRVKEDMEKFKKAMVKAHEDTAYELERSIEQMKKEVVVDADGTTLADFEYQQKHAKEAEDKKEST